MNTSITKIIIALMAFPLSGCLEQLQPINSTLAKTNSALSTTASVPRSATAMQAPPTAVLSGSQKEAIQQHLAAKVADRAIVQAREEAKVNIEKVLQMSACYPNWDVSRYLAGYSVATNTAFPAPMAWMQYHPKSQCLSVERVDTWKMLAKNALSFRAVYVSDASGESRSENYRLIKQPDGAWLFANW